MSIKLLIDCSDLHVHATRQMNRDTIALSHLYRNHFHYWKKTALTLNEKWSRGKGHDIWSSTTKEQLYLNANHVVTSRWERKLFATPFKTFVRMSHSQRQPFTTYEKIIPLSSVHSATNLRKFSCTESKDLQYSMHDGSRKYVRTWILGMWPNV